MFRILDKHIFKSLIKPFFFGLLGSLIILGFGPLNNAIKYALKGQIPATIILQWFVFRLPDDMQFAFPVASLMASLLAFAQLSKEGELTAMRAAGISLVRLLIPVAIFGIFATGGTYVFLNQIKPPSMVRSEDLWARYFRKTEPPTYKSNFTLKGSGSRLISVGRVNLRDPILERVEIREYEPRTARLIRRQTSPKATWNELKRTWFLEHVRIEDFSQEIARIETMRLIEVDLGAEPGIFQAKERRPDELSPQQLQARIEDLESRGLGMTRDLKVDLYLKSSFPFCVLIFAILGAVMGITNSRSGGFMGFGIALVLTFVYYVSMSLCSSMGKSGAMDPLLSAWIHNYAFFALTLWKAYQASSR